MAPGLRDADFWPALNALSGAHMQPAGGHTAMYAGPVCRKALEAQACKALIQPFMLQQFYESQSCVDRVSRMLNARTLYATFPVNQHSSLPRE